MVALLMNAILIIVAFFNLGVNEGLMRGLENFFTLNSLRNSNIVQCESANVCVCNTFPLFKSLSYSYTSEDISLHNFSCILTFCILLLNYYATSKIAEFSMSEFFIVLFGKVQNTLKFGARGWFFSIGYSKKLLGISTVVIRLRPKGETLFREITINTDECTTISELKSEISKVYNGKSVISIIKNSEVIIDNDLDILRFKILDILDIELGEKQEIS